MMPDPKALKILFDTYWTSAGWKSSPAYTPPADYAYAVAAGVMFDPVVLDHDAVVRWAVRVRKRVEPRRVAAAFVASLGARRLDWRSALGSYAAARHLPRHSFVPSRVYSADVCAVCGEYRAGAQERELSRFNFERCKWGGVSHADVDYQAFDLERFLAEEPAEPCAADWLILRDILAAARRQRAGARVGDLEKALVTVVKSNKDERRVLLEILGVCGVLQPAGQASFLRGFVNHDDRPETDSDWHYPFCWWHGPDGVCDEAVAFWFPEV
jgi:hypothetical protein